MTSDRPAPPFQAHIQLLQVFLAHRDAIVDRIQAMLNAQERPAYQLQDRAQLSRQFEEAFFGLPVITRDQSALRGQLQAAHWAEDFKPRDMPGIPNEMFDPADMMVRAFTMWRSTRWPGRNGRVRFAQTLFNLHAVRCLALLTLRIWDEGDGASDRLAQLQRLLDALWKSAPSDQPVLVRDVRWLVPVAQSPTTDELAPYFRVAEKVAARLADADRLEIHKAAVVMAGGHLRSQLRHFLMQGKTLGDHELLLSTRRSNALDCAMTIQALAPLLAAYSRAVQGGDAAHRAELAGVICQGISPDPELFVNRLDLLRAYSMIEHLYVERDAGQTILSAMGRRHIALVDQYVELMPSLASSLAGDCEQFRPREGHYSPHGVMYGFSSNLLEHMTMKASQPEADIRFSLEDVFRDEGAGAERLAWVSGWRQLPHVPREVQKLYAYPQQFAGEIFARIGQALRQPSQPAAGVRRTGRLFVSSGSAQADATVPVLSARFVQSSDADLVTAQRAQARDQAGLLLDRNEGEFLVSYATPGGWVAISKDVLTDVLGAGADTRLGDVPVAAVQVLALLYPDLVVIE